MNSAYVFQMQACKCVGKEEGYLVRSRAAPLDPAPAGLAMKAGRKDRGLQQLEGSSYPRSLHTLISGASQWDERYLLCSQLVIRKAAWALPAISFWWQLWAVTSETQFTSSHLESHSKLAKNKKNPQTTYTKQFVPLSCLLKMRPASKCGMNDPNKGNRSFHGLPSLQILQRLMLTLFYKRKTNTKQKSPNR